MFPRATPLCEKKKITFVSGVQQSHKKQTHKNNHTKTITQKQSPQKQSHKKNITKTITQKQSPQKEYNKNNHTKTCL